MCPYLQPGNSTRVWGRGGAAVVNGTIHQILTERRGCRKTKQKQDKNKKEETQWLIDANVICMDNQRNKLTAATEQNETETEYEKAQGGVNDDERTANRDPRRRQRQDASASTPSVPF